MSTLKFFALLFLLPGLAGLIVSAMISTHYLDVHAEAPGSEELRTVPRNIHGTVVYQTEQEDLKLDEIEYGSVGVFLIGLVLGLIYLEKWGAAQVEDDERIVDREPRVKWPGVGRRSRG